MRVNKISARRKQVKRLGFRIYKSKLKAIILAWIFSRINQEVNWVIKEPEGYMVINLRLMEMMNKIRQKIDPNAKKTQVRDLNKYSVYRGFDKSWGKLKVNTSQRLKVVER